MAGIEAYGIEPAMPGAQVGHQQFAERAEQHAPISCAIGEALPFPNAAFDVVCSFQVLEHTRMPERVLAETLRVLKPGGYFVHVFPNYGSFCEGHYGVPWIPHLPKAVGRLYIRLLGRDPSMMNELQLLSHQSMQRLLKRYPEARIVSWGFDLWERRLRTLEFWEWAYLGRLKRAVAWLHRLHLIGLTVWLGRLFAFETPIVLVGAKTSSLKSHAAAGGMTDVQSG